MGALFNGGTLEEFTGPAHLSPKRLRVKEVLTEGMSLVVPVGSEFLWRGDILGVPGVLDGLSHVVSVGLMRGRRKGNQ